MTAVMATSEITFPAPPESAPRAVILTRHRGIRRAGQLRCRWRIDNVPPIFNLRDTTQRPLAANRTIRRTSLALSLAVLSSCFQACSRVVDNLDDSRRRLESPHRAIRGQLGKVEAGTLQATEQKLIGASPRGLSNRMRFEVRRSTLRVHQSSSFVYPAFASLIRAWTRVRRLT